jgi:DNA polymerase/3'-5' exonuclease PolX
MSKPPVIIDTSSKRLINDIKMKGSGRMASTVNKTVETKVSIETPVRNLSGVAGKEAKKAFDAFNALKAAQKVLDEQKAAAEATLREILGDAETVAVEGEEIFKLAHRTNTSIDKKKLLEVFPEAYDATLKQTPYTFITAC